MKSKWIKGLPKKNGWYWIRYKLKKGNNTYKICSFYCKYSNYSSFNTIHGDLNQIFGLKKYRYYWIPKDVKNGEYVFTTRPRGHYKARKADFEFIEHWNQPTKLVPEIRYEDIK